jgi:hypothetical protein
MEIAEQGEDEYEARLHRGIGLYYLALKRAELAEAATELTTETILCKAAGELALARLFEPEDARPCWYLYLVWSQLGQSQAASKHLALACALAPFSALTVVEQRDLELSCRHHLDVVEDQRR